MGQTCPLNEDRHTLARTWRRETRGPEGLIRHGNGRGKRETGAPWRQEVAAGVTIMALEEVTLEQGVT